MFSLLYNAIEEQVIVSLQQAFAEVVGLGDSYDKFKIDSTNNILVMTSSQGGTNVSLTIPTGYYYGDALATKIQTLVSASSLVGAITVSYFYTTKFFRFTINSGTIVINNTTSTVGWVLGFVGAVTPAIMITSNYSALRCEDSRVSAMYQWKYGKVDTHRPLPGDSKIYIGTPWETPTSEEFFPSVRVSCTGGGESQVIGTNPNFTVMQNLPSHISSATSALYPSTPTVPFIRQQGRWVDVPVNIEVKSFDYDGAGELLNMVGLFIHLYNRDLLEQRGIVISGPVRLGTREVENRGEAMDDQVYKASLSFNVCTEWSVDIPLFGRWLAGIVSGRMSNGEQQPMAGIGDIFRDVKVTLHAY